MYIYIYIYREREREIFTHTHTLVRHYRKPPGAADGVAAAARELDTRGVAKVLFSPGVNICTYIYIYIYIHIYSYINK